MVAELLRPAKARPGDRVAVLSPSFAAPGVAPAVHEQALRRLEELTGLVPVEYPTTRQVGADARARADDLNAALGDPGIRAVLATIGGEDQITVIPHLDADLVRADPKPFLGYSDNTNLLSWLSDHENPGEATLQVLVGQVRLSWSDGAVDLDAGGHVVIPQERHGLLAVTDAVVLLTAAKT